MHRYGIGHWDEMGRDERLGLGEKLALAAVEKRRGKEKELATDPELRHLPKGKHTSWLARHKWHTVKNCRWSLVTGDALQEILSSSQQLTICSPLFLNHFPCLQADPLRWYHTEI